jgi:predicted nucleotidyltransferase component of viral defense system
VRRYDSPAAFRAAVEARLRNRARRRGIAAYILRRQTALERLIARLTKVAPGRWALKGGLALEIRLGEYARPSVDLDADHAHGASAARADLERAVAEDLGDHFAFAIAGSEELREGGVSLAVRYKIHCSLARRPFEPLQVDVTVAPPDPWDAEPACRPGLLAEFHLGPVEVLVVPLERQLAEKLHAYTRTYNGGTTRAKDLVDFVLVRQHLRLDAKRLKDAIRRTFDSRGTHPVPYRLPTPPPELAVPYRREAEEVGIDASLDEAHRLAAEWLDPVLACAVEGTWDPDRMQWVER